jgi:exonuclease III
MGNDIMCWRAAIGIFNCKLGGGVLCKENFYFHFDIFLVLMNLFVCTGKLWRMCLKVSANTFLNLEFSTTMFLLVVMSGDVEINPGPYESNVGPNCISILHLNIRSIRNKIDFIVDNLLDYDILCFTETHLTDNVRSESLTIDNYSNMYRKDVSAHSGGLLIYVPDNIISSRKDELEIILPESIWIEFKDKNEIILICTVYRPPRSNIDFWNRMNICIEKALEISKKIVIVGDINEDQLNPNSYNLKNIMVTNNLRNVILKPTRVTAHTSTLIDPILISDQINYSDSDTIDTPDIISDHHGTYIFIKSNQITNKVYKRQVWNYKMLTSLC